jgi:hypothetical protein
VLLLNLARLAIIGAQRRGDEASTFGIVHSIDSNGTPHEASQMESVTNE